MTHKPSEGKKAISGWVTMRYDDGSEETFDFDLSDGSCLVVTTTKEQKQHDLEVARKAFDAGQNSVVGDAIYDKDFADYANVEFGE